jgi:hypothetical protein
MNFYQLRFWGVLVLHLPSSSPIIAQTEHHVGMIAGKVVGPIYTLQHNRWNVTATGGWLTGLRDGHVAVTGGYRLLYNRSGVMMVDAGLGLFGQKYTALTARQEQWAREMEYDVPFGALLATKLHVDIAERWSYEMHVGTPLYFTEKGR